jgi:hypothetical protein
MRARVGRRGGDGVPRLAISPSAMVRPGRAAEVGVADAKGVLRRAVLRRVVAGHDVSIRGQLSLFSEAPTDFVRVRVAWCRVHMVQRAEGLFACVCACVRVCVCVV